MKRGSVPSFVFGLFILAFSSACAQVPEAPKSLYFERLVNVVRDGGYSRHELLEPRSQADEEQVVADLVDDGFKPQDNSSSAEMFGQIVCEQLVFSKHDVFSDEEKYYRSFIWGSPFITDFQIEVYRRSDCSVLAVTGMRVRQGL